VAEVKSHMDHCHFELNRWLIDLFTNEVKENFDKLSRTFNSKFDAVNDRINAIAYQVNELSRVVHDDDSYGDSEDGDHYDDYSDSEDGGHYDDYDEDEDGDEDGDENDGGEEGRG